MNTEETKDKGSTEKNTDFGFAPMKQMMSEMISKCCTGQGGFPDCSARMKSMMEAKTNQSCCTPKTEDTEHGRKK
jgi:hypothetical protein